MSSAEPLVPDEIDQTKFQEILGNLDPTDPLVREAKAKNRVYEAALAGKSSVSEEVQNTEKEKEEVIPQLPGYEDFEKDLEGPPKAVHTEAYMIGDDKKRVKKSVTISVDVNCTEVAERINAFLISHYEQVAVRCVEELENVKTENLRGELESRYEDAVRRKMNLLSGTESDVNPQVFLTVPETLKIVLMVCGTVGGTEIVTSPDPEDLANKVYAGLVNRSETLAKVSKLVIKDGNHMGNLYSHLTTQMLKIQKGQQKSEKP